MSFAHLPIWQIVTVTLLSAGLTYLAMVLSLWLCSRIPSDRDDGSDFVPLLAFPLASGFVCCVVAFRSGSIVPILFAVMLLMTLSACWVSDVRRGVVFDWFILPPILAAVAVAFATHDFFPLISAGVVAFPFALTSLVSKGKGTGWGDVKLVAAAASVVGLQASIFVLVLACLLASSVAFARRRPKNEPIRFAPYLGALFAIALVLPQPGVH